jgi:hypothetical protein
MTGAVKKAVQIKRLYNSSKIYCSNVQNRMLLFAAQVFQVRDM